MKNQKFNLRRASLRQHLVAAVLMGLSVQVAQAGDTCNLNGGIGTAAHLLPARLPLLAVRRPLGPVIPVRQ